MSGGKKKYPKKKTYTEGEFRYAVKKVGDEAIARILLLCIVAARDQFDLDEDGIVEFMNTMQRYVEYEQKGLIDTKAASESLKKRTGIDLRIR